MDKIIHRSLSRGHAHHGWLDTYHSFSFGEYYDHSRMNFGALRVLNDDTVAGGKGFGMHPHDNMEIVTIPLTGALEHRDNTGRHGVIQSGDVQIMSAGTGIAHSEFNASPTQPVNLLQIWVLPKKRNIKPRYDQRGFDLADRTNHWQTVVSPNEEDKVLWINQDAWFSLSRLEAGKSLSWVPKLPSGGLYLFMINGKAAVAGETLDQRDGLGISKLQGNLEIESLEGADLLLMEIPLS